VGTATGCDQFDLQSCTSQKGCQISQIISKFNGARVSSSEDLKISDGYEISESSTFVKRIDFKISDMFSIGKDKFIDSDSIGDSVRSAISTHSCTDSKTSVESDIRSKISDLQSSLNSQYSSQNINFIINVENIDFDPSCNSKVSVRVLTSIKDMLNSYLVYDSVQQTLDLRTIQINFYTLSGDYQI
jgi:hypothetical protein